MKSPKFVMCVSNTGVEVSLEINRIYRVLPKRSLQPDVLRVVDETQEDYMFSADMFVPVTFSKDVLRALRRK